MKQLKLIKQLETNMNEKDANKKPAAQQDIFLTVLATTFLRLKSSLCIMKTHRSLMKESFDTFFINVIPFQKETIQEHTKHQFVLLSAFVNSKT